MQICQGGKISKDMYINTDKVNEDFTTAVVRKGGKLEFDIITPEVGSILRYTYFRNNGTFSILLLISKFTILISIFLLAFTLLYFTIYYIQFGYSQFSLSPYNKFLVQSAYLSSSRKMRTQIIIYTFILDIYTYTFHK